MGFEITPARAWLGLVAALAIHVIDEAATGFLDFYNPLVLRIRSQWAWFPMPTFTFEVWIVGLALLVATLALLTPAIRRGGPAAVVASAIFSVLMFLNGVAHLAGSLVFGRWLPGATSAPLMIVASIVLARVVARRRTGR